MDDDFELQGNTFTSSGKLLSISVNTCQNITGVYDECKSSQEIDAYLSYKFIVLHANEKSFNASKYHEDSIQQISRLHWFRVSTQIEQ